MLITKLRFLFLLCVLFHKSFELDVNTIVWVVVVCDGAGAVATLVRFSQFPIETDSIKCVDTVLAQQTLLDLTTLELGPVAQGGVGLVRRWDVTMPELGLELLKFREPLRPRTTVGVEDEASPFQHLDPCRCHRRFFLPIHHDLVLVPLTLDPTTKCREFLRRVRNVTVPELSFEGEQFFQHH